jgi:hypothetical protein
MTKPNKPTRLAIYRAALKRYEEAGDTERAELQRRLIARVEAE